MGVGFRPPLFYRMPINLATYNPHQTPIHRVDARCKIVLLIVYSVALFCVHSWWALGLLALAALVVAALARIRIGASMHMLLPVGLLLLFMLLANSFSFDVYATRNYAGLAGVSAGVFADAEPIPLIGSFGFMPDGFVRGCFYLGRISLLILASLELTTTTTSTELTEALCSFLRPLGHLGVPVRDVATVISIALRFIPVTVDEFETIRTAQTSRGATFDTGSIIKRVKAWIVVLVPLFVGLYRRADSLAQAMDARCYGSGEATSLVSRSFALSQALILGIGLAFCIAVSVFG